MSNYSKNSRSNTGFVGSGTIVVEKELRKADIFAGNLRERREELGLTQKELAIRTQINVNTIQNYESGSSFPKGDYAIALADELTCTIDWLLSGRGERPKPPPPDGKDDIIRKEEDVPDPENVPAPSQSAYKDDQALSVIGRLMDKNDRLEAKNDKLESKIEDLEEELERYREATLCSPEKKAESV